MLPNCQQRQIFSLVVSVQQGLPGGRENIFIYAWLFAAVVKGRKD